MHAPGHIMCVTVSSGMIYDACVGTLFCLDWTVSCVDFVLSLIGTDHDHDHDHDRDVLI